MAKSTAPTVRAATASTGTASTATTGSGTAGTGTAGTGIAGTATGPTALGVLRPVLLMLAMYDALAWGFRDVTGPRENFLSILGNVLPMEVWEPTGFALTFRVVFVVAAAAWLFDLGRPLSSWIAVATYWIFASVYVESHVYTQHQSNITALLMPILALADLPVFQSRALESRASESSVSQSGASQAVASQAGSPSAGSPPNGSLQESSDEAGGAPTAAGGLDGLVDRLFRDPSHRLVLDHASPRFEYVALFILCSSYAWSGALKFATSGFPWADGTALQIWAWSSGLDGPLRDLLIDNLWLTRAALIMTLLGEGLALMALLGRPLRWVFAAAFLGFHSAAMFVFGFFFLGNMASVFCLMVFPGVRALRVSASR